MACVKSCQGAAVRAEFLTGWRDGRADLLPGAAPLLRRGTTFELTPPQFNLQQRRVKKRQES